MTDEYLKRLPDGVKELLKTVFDDCMKEDSSVRERQIRKYKRLKLLWEGYQRIWYSEVAHDWRVWDEQEYGDSSGDQSYYDKPINVFSAYLETIVAALSVIVPPIRNFPEDADNSLDLITARASDKVGELIYRHNNVGLLWLHQLFVYCTEGMVAVYSYPHSDNKYGTYEEKIIEEVPEDTITATCPHCQHLEELESAPSPEELQEEPCPECGQPGIPVINTETNQVDRVKEIKIQPKTRVCMEAYGGLNVKIGNYAKTQKQLPYLIFSEEVDYSVLIDEFEDYLDQDCIDKLKQQDEHGSYDQYGQWGRLNPQYQEEYPQNVVTKNCCWIRPSKFNCLEDQEDVKRLKKLFPDGVKVVVFNDILVCAKNESLDKHWTLLKNPMSDYLTFEPLGMKLTSVQDITNDLISLTLQTIEHGIGQTFADPSVMDFTAYSQNETTPGAIYPTKTLGGKKINEAFFEVRTAQLSSEVMPFGQSIQSLGQLSTGALPSMFGGQLEGSETASEYSMSRAQALQRQQNVWKMFTTMWKEIFSKNIPMFIENMKDDERDVQKNADGNFINVFILRSELQGGKVGKVELEANENLPMTWGQRKDMLEKLMTNGHPELMTIIGAPENKAVLHEYLGLDDFYVPGEDDIIKQYDEIKELLESEPMDDGTGELVASVPIDPIYDNHQIEFEIVRKWVISPEGRATKVTNPAGHENVLLHGMLHFQQIQQQQMMQQQNQPAKEENGANPPKPKKQQDNSAPITGDNDVVTVQ